MVENIIIETYKELNVKMECAKIMEEIYLDELEHASTIVSEEKKYEIEKKIKEKHQLFLKYKKNFKKLEDLIFENIYVKMTDYEKVIFVDHFLRKKTAEEIVNTHKDMNLSIQSVYNFSNKVNERLRKIKFETYIPQEN